MTLMEAVFTQRNLRSGEENLPGLTVGFLTLYKENCFVQSPKVYC